MGADQQLCPGTRGCYSTPCRQYGRPEQEAVRFRSSQCFRRSGVVFNAFRRMDKCAGQVAFNHLGSNDTSRAPPDTGLTLTKGTRSTPGRPGHSDPCGAQAIHDIADAHVACTPTGRRPASPAAVPHPHPPTPVPQLARRHRRGPTSTQLLVSLTERSGALPGRLRARADVMWAARVGIRT